MKLYSSLLCVLLLLMGSCRTTNTLQADNFYTKTKIFQQFADTLTRLTKKYDTNKQSIYKLTTNEPTVFWVIDLAKPTNKSMSKDFKPQTINFIDGHIYFFSSMIYYHAFHNIAFLDKGQVKIFSAINCTQSNYTLKDVLNYATLFLQNNPQKEKIMKNIQNYQHYGMYIKMCGMAQPMCR